MKILHKIGFIFSLCLLFAFSSCTAELNLSLDKNGNTSVEFNSAMGKVLENLILSVSSSQEKNSAQSVFNAEEIKRSFLNFGFTNVSSQVKDISKIFLYADLPSASKKSANKKTEENFILSDSLEISSEKISLSLSPEILKNLLENAEEDLQTYAELFMAPIFTGEEMSLNEYEELLSGVYGKAVAQEIMESNLKINLCLPSGKKASFSVPFSELLILTEKKEFTVSQ